MFKVLFFGDVIGRLGRRGVAAVLPHLKDQYRPDFVIANAENLAHGKGVTSSTLQELKNAGVNFFTSGNHVFKKPEVYDFIDNEDTVLIRPANYPPETPGKGSKLVSIGNEKLLVINLMGRVFLTENFDCPFRALDSILEEYKDVSRIGTIIDFHAEATSEKSAFGLYADGRVSAVLGTHTHIPTADARIMSNGTAHISDIGMSGGKNTVIGVDKENVIKGFLTQQPVMFEIPETGICIVNAVLITIDPSTQKAVEIKQIQEDVEIS